jgi:acetyltransferase-like isoleucine patch superfamily enzyme
MGLVGKKHAKAMLARLLARTAVGLAADPLPHAEAVGSQGGFSAICRLLSICEGEAAARLLRRYGARVGARPMIRPGLTVVNAEGRFDHLSMGDGSHLGESVLLDLQDRIDIGSRVTIADRSLLLTHSNAGESRSPLALAGRRVAPIHIGDDAYIGAGVIVLPGVSIGAEAVVGAGSVVTRDVPPRSVAVGNPARPLQRKLEQINAGSGAARAAQQDDREPSP